MTNTSHTPGRYQQAGRVHAAQLKEGLRIAESCALANKATCEDLRAHNAALLAALRDLVAQTGALVDYREDDAFPITETDRALRDARAALAAATVRT